MHEYIRPQKVINALRWLIQNNELYKDIQLCENWEQRWHEDDQDLWRAMLSNEHGNERDKESDNGCDIDHGQMTIAKERCEVYEMPQTVRYFIRHIKMVFNLRSIELEIQSYHLFNRHDVDLIYFEGYFNDFESNKHSGSYIFTFA